MSNEDTLRSIGKTPPEDAGRDAVHFAVVPVVAGVDFRPGDRAIVIGDKAYPINSGAAIGIIDPFRKGEVFAGERAWLFLNPGSITSLRHTWTHPSFMDEA